MAASIAQALFHKLMADGAVATAADMTPAKGVRAQAAADAKADTTRDIHGALTAMGVAAQAAVEVPLSPDAMQARADGAAACGAARAEVAALVQVVRLDKT